MEPPIELRKGNFAALHANLFDLICTDYCLHCAQQHCAEAKCACVADRPEKKKYCILGFSESIKYWCKLEEVILQSYCEGRETLESCHGITNQQSRYCMWLDHLCPCTLCA